MVIAVLLAAAIPGAEAKKKNKEGTAKLEFREKVYDFGNVEEQGGPVSHNFVFDNAGDGNLVIYEATAECGCTRPEYPKNPVTPGKSDKLKVTFNPIGRIGSFEKVVSVKTNGEPRKVRVKIRGNVVKGK